MFFRKSSQNQFQVYGQIPKKLIKKLKIYYQVKMLKVINLCNYLNKIILFSKHKDYNEIVEEEMGSSLTSSNISSFN